MPLHLTVENVLLIEIDNQNGIYLYRENEFWCAYERSAYYLAAMSLPVELKKEVVKGIDLVVLKAYFRIETVFEQLTASSKFAQLEQLADNSIKYQIHLSLNGFGDWKKQMLGACSA